MALGDPYATTAEVKPYVSISDTDDDAQLDVAVQAATDFIIEYCGRDFNQVGTGNETTRLFRPANHWTLWVDDIADTTNLAIKTDEDDDGTFEVTWSSGDYQLEPLNQIVAGKTGWPYTRIRAVESFLFPVHSERASVEVTANWGWPSVPQQVKHACIIQASVLFKRATEGAAPIVTMDGTTLPVSRFLDNQAKMLLDRFDDFPVGAG